MKRGCRKTAFTLIELLSVIAVIAILAALLFPALSSSQERGRMAQCLSNVRQWGTATTLYLSDNGGVFPEKGTAADDGAVTGDDLRNNKMAWYNILPPYVSTLPMSNVWDKAGQMPRPLMKSLFICPSAKPELTIGDKEYRTYYSSYAQNCWIDSRQRGCSEEGASGYGRILRLSQVKNPAVFPIMAENATGGTSYKLAHTHTSIMGSRAPDAFRHNGLANIAFADGHAASFKKDKIYDTSVADTYWNYGGIQWNPDRKLDGTCGP